MALYKIGSSLKITKTAASTEELVLDRPLTEQIPGTKILEPKNNEFVYIRARAISSMETNGPNGNFDSFPWRELQASYETFVGKNLFLNHESDSPIKSVGKIIDSTLIEDPETNEKYVECIAKIDKRLHPEIARMVETGVLNTVSMGCSCDESTCSVCGTKLHSDADEKCEHLSALGLGKQYIAEVDFPEFNIKQGDKIKAYAINSGINFNELSIVNVPADSKAIIKTVISNIRQRLTKKASLSKEEQLDLVSQMENLFSKLDTNTAQELKAEFCGCPTPVKEEVPMSDKNIVSEDQKKILSKISALEMEQLESYIQHKTKKANEKEVIAEATKKEENFLSKIVAKVKDSFAAQLLEKKVEAVAKEELSKEASKCVNCGHARSSHDADPEMGCKLDKCDHWEETTSKKSFLSAKFNEDKNSILASTWSIYNGDRLLVEASLKDIWGSQFETLSFEDQKYATSAEYAKDAVSRLVSDGLEKLAYYWDVTPKIEKTAANGEFFKATNFFVPGSDSNNNWQPEDIKKHDEKDGHVVTEYTFNFPGQEEGQKGPVAPGHADLKTEYTFKKPEGTYFKPGSDSDNNWKPEDIKKATLKTASEPKLGPDGKQFKPGQDSSNKEHDIKTEYTTEKPGQESGQKGPAAPAGKDLKTEYKLDMPGQEKGQTGPAAPKHEDVKTEYSVSKPEGKKFDPKNPEEKDLKKSEKEMKTDYVAEGKEHQEEEEKETSSKKSYKEQNSIIKWSAMSPEAQDFIKKHVEKHIKEDGMERAQAVRVAYEEARKKGMNVPEAKSSQETIMEKKAKTSGDASEEASKESTLPEGKKTYEGKPDEASKESTEPKSSATSGSKPEEASASTLPEGKKTYEGTPDEASKESTQPKDKKTSGDKPEEASKESTQPESKATVGGTPDEAVKGSTQAKAALETKADEKDLTAPPVVDKVMSDKPDMAVQKEEAMGAYASALDKAEKLDIGEGYSASKDKETKEIIISKDGKEVKRLPDGFANEVPEVLKLLRAVLGLPPVEEKKEMAPMVPAPETPKMEEAPKPEEHPALEEAHEDEMGMKESALKVREEAVSKKEAELKAIEVKSQEEEKAKKFAALLSARSERCQKIVASMVDKQALKMDQVVYESELKNGTYLLDAQHKAFQASIKAKHKELLAMDDMSLKAFEKVVEELPLPSSSNVNTKKATRVPYLTYDPSEADEVGNIFKQMGTLKGKSINDVPKK